MSVSGLKEVALDAALVVESKDPAFEERRAFHTWSSPEEMDVGDVGDVGEDGSSTSDLGWSEGVRAAMAAM